MGKWITVVETNAFLKVSETCLQASEKQELIAYLASDPKIGALIPGTGELRKIRMGSAEQGKRGGYRVIYYFYNETAPLFLLWIYRKNQQADLTMEQKKQLTKLTTELKQQMQRGFYG